MTGTTPEQAGPRHEGAVVMPTRLTQLTGLVVKDPDHCQQQQSTPLWAPTNSDRTATIVVTNIWTVNVNEGSTY